MTTISSRAIKEWVILTLLLVAFLIGFTPLGNSDYQIRYGKGPIGTLDRALLDGGNRLLARSPDSRIALIEIDEQSLALIGRWPWMRSIHANLIQRLTLSAPNKIILDLLFPESTADDELLGKAMTAHGQVYLPIAPQLDNKGMYAPIYPVPTIGKAAKALGHTQFLLDPDGLVRGLYQTEGGFTALSILITAQNDQNLPNDNNAVASSIASGKWPQIKPQLLPAIDDSIDRYSYASVLRGDIAAEKFRGKIILIGSTAKGLGDFYANSILSASTLSPGIELHAAAVNAQLQPSMISSVNMPVQLLVTVTLLLVTMAIIYRVGPRQSLILVITISVVILIASYLLLRIGWWFAPGALIASVLLAYPLWSWRRLEAAMGQLTMRAAQLRASAVDIPNLPLGPVSVEPVARSLQALDNAADYALTLRDFLRKIIEEIPYPVWVSDPTDKPLLSNAAASKHFAYPSNGVASIRTWLASRLDQTELVDGKEYSVGENHWLLRLQSFNPPASDRNIQVWLYQLVDITALRNTQRERDQMMHFLSHDMRSPQISILSILQQRPSTDQQKSWVKDIRAQTERTLGLANGVVNLARAEAIPLQSELLGVDSLVSEAVDACWAAAAAKKIKIIHSLASDEIEIHADANLLRRAFINLIDNAIKFSPADSLVTVIISRENGNEPEAGKGTFVEISVSDHGVGLSNDQLGKVFQPYWRANEDIAGVGLGLNFVNLAATKHGGSMRVQANLPCGATFVMRLPLR